MAEERARPEEQLHRLEKSHQQLWTLIDSVKDYAIFTLDTSGNVTSWSQSAQAMTGYAESEVLGKHFSLFFTPEAIARDDPQRSLTQAAREGRFEEDGWRLRKDGTLFWANVVITALRDPAGRLTGFGKVTRDLTRRKWGEEERFAKIFRASPTCLAITTLHDGRIVDVNEGFERLTGYTREELLGRTALEMNLWPRSQDRSQMVRALQSRRSLRDREGEVRDKEGNVHAVIVSFEMLELGGHDSILTAVRDISERKRIEQELVRANQTLIARVEELNRRTEETTLLSQMAHLLQSCFSSEEAYSVIGQSAAKLFPGDSGALYVLDEGKKTVERQAAWGNDLRSLPNFGMDHCWALRRGRVHLVKAPNDGMLCPHVEPPCPPLSLCVPMIAKSETRGVFYVQGSAESGRWAEDRQALAYTVAEHVGLALANMRLQESLRLQSTRDVLTGLFNRRYLGEALERELRRAGRGGRPLGLIMMDIDHFKTFNDRFGHEAGDTVLKELGRLLQTYSRKDDIACRLGGEEFVLVLPEATFETTRQRAEQLRNRVQALDLQTRGRGLGRITLSLGVALFPNHGSTAEDLLYAADTALYQAKADGRNRVISCTMNPSRDERQA